MFWGAFFCFEHNEDGATLLLNCNIYYSHYKYLYFRADEILTNDYCYRF
jgi:hypothetical protein